MSATTSNDSPARQRSASHSGSARRLSRARSSSSLLDEFFRHPERRAVWQRTEERANHEQATKMENRQVMGDLVDFCATMSRHPTISCPFPRRATVTRG
ncbi:unnamed protein product, partial [Parascedosporium putredinis]